MELQSENADIGTELESEQKRSKFPPKLKKLVSELTDLLEKLKMDKKTYKTELLSEQKKAQQLEGDLAEKDSECEDLVTKLETHRKNLKKLSDEKLSLTTQVTQSKEKAEGAKKTINDLKTDKSGLKNQLKELKSKHDGQDKTIFEFKTRNDKIERDNSDLKTQVDNLKNKMIQGTGNKNMGYSGILKANTFTSQEKTPKASSPMKRSGLVDSMVLGGGGKNRETVETHFRSTSLTKNKSGGK
jgi:chromosome segregation ATPase